MLYYFVIIESLAAEARKRSGDAWIIRSRARAADSSTSA